MLFPVLEIRDLYLAASPESRVKLFTGFKAAPFIDPATGWAHFRARWYDLTTGSWLTPDPMGYEDSSNLYAAFRSDPVNLSDPRGEAVPLLVAGAVYLGSVLLNSAIDVGVDYLFADEGEFDINASLGTNVTINALTGGWGGKLSKAKHLKRLSRLGRYAIGEGAEYAVDVAATGMLDTMVYDHSAAEGYGTAAIGGAIGRGLGHGFERVAVHGRVQAAVAASRAARTKSRFNEFAVIDRGLTPFEQYMRLVETLDVSTASNKAVFYSGPGNSALAEAFAKRTGRTTLE